MEFGTIVRTIADILKSFDSERPRHKQFQPGIGPFGEPQLIGEIAKRFSAAGLPAVTKRTPDLLLKSGWGIEFKIVRPFGDNGREAENWSVNLLHPYQGNTSLLGDAHKLLHLEAIPCLGLVVIGFEHDPARISLDPLLQSFEIIARGVMGFNIAPRVEESRRDLVHPEHQVLRCVGWELRRGI